MRKFTTLFFTLFCMCACTSVRKSVPAGESGPVQAERSIRIVFWNVENLFDTINDPLTQDDEYTPEGSRHWNGFKYRHKLRNLAQALAALGGWERPAVIGLCEVENRSVVYDLFHTTILKQAGYQLIHEESKDPRGIDPVFVYDPKQFRAYTHKKVELVYEKDTGRHILYMAGTAGRGDTLHLFMNHWPSKFSGARETDPKRMRAAQTLLDFCNGIWKNDSAACIIAGGDFNDEPREKSIVMGLQAADPAQWAGNRRLYNLATGVEGGSHKFREHWSLIDQVFVSGACLKRLYGPSQQLGTLPFLLKDDLTYMGQKPFRTFTGFSWEGGYADHLPVYIDLYVK